MPPPPDTRYLTVTGAVLPDNTFVRDPGFLVDGDTGEDRDGALLVEMLAADGSPLLRRRVRLEEACSDGVRTGVRLVTATVPAPPATAAVRFSVGPVVVEDYVVPKSEPKVEAPVVERARGPVWRVRWGGEHPDGARLTYALGFSHDGGETWQPLGLPTELTAADLPVGELPGGKRCVVSVTASDGFHTVTRRSKLFALPVSPCLAMILAPEEGTQIPVPGTLRLQGQGYWREEGVPELEALEWTSSVDGFLGNGPVLEVQSPSPGRHEISLVAGTGARAGRAATTVIVGDAPAPRPRRGRRR